MLEVIFFSPKLEYMEKAEFTSFPNKTETDVEFKLKILSEQHWDVKNSKEGTGGCVCVCCTIIHFVRTLAGGPAFP